MIDLPPKDEIDAAIARDDYPWLVENVLIPCTVSLLRNEKAMAELVKGAPRPRRLAGTGRRRHSHRQARRIPQVPG
jgi:hypothetical protein